MIKYLIILLLVPAIGRCQPENDFNSRLKTTDSATFFLAFVRADCLKPYFPQKLADQYYDKATHTFKGGYSGLYKDVIKYYAVSANKKFILNKLDQWLRNDSLLNDIQDKSGAEMEEVFYYTSSVRHLVKKYILSKTQSWSSLTSWQSYELYIDFMNYAISLTRQGAAELFSALRKTAGRL